jgi:LPXTG-motif cell wall-anchored protein
VNTIVNTSWMPLLTSVAAARPAAFPDSDPMKESRSPTKERMLRGTLTRRATVPSRGVPARRQIAVLAAVFAVAAAPGAAFAQNGAGDEQYQDPFAGSSTPKPTPKPKPVQPVPHQQVQTQTQATPQPATTSATTTATTGGELPRTGLNLAPLVAAGVVLVAAGLLLRRRPRHGRD